MHDQPNDLDSRPDDERLRRLDETVERLTSDVTSLKLEVATLISALRDSQFQYVRRIVKPPQPVAPPSRASLAPAAVVVLIAAALLSWQLIYSPHAGVPSAVVNQAPSIAQTIEPVAHAAAPPVEAPSTEPPITPLVRPTIYKGTLAVKSDQPGAIVFVNRQNVGVAPVRLRNLRAGAHLVWVEHDGYRRWTRVVTVPAERVTQVTVDLEPLEH